MISNRDIVAPFTGSVDWNPWIIRRDNFLQVAPFTGSVDWNSLELKKVTTYTESLPSRGAWIEIYLQSRNQSSYRVAPFTGSVDWNISSAFSSSIYFSRSLHGERGLKFYLIREKVKRNEGRSLHGERGLKSLDVTVLGDKKRSLPSRGAWIEISMELFDTPRMTVAPFTGSVDWNTDL